jgi:spoIIIJ-associated protein
MIDQNDLEAIRARVEEFFQKMAMPAQEVSASIDGHQSPKEMVAVEITVPEPQMIIGKEGQTLFELNRLLRIMLNKALGKEFYVSVDINHYKKKKHEHLKELAAQAADEVAMNGREMVLPPMSSYERRIVHAELASRHDIATESRGEGPDRQVVIKPKS